MSKAYHHILGAVADEVWAMQPSKLQAMLGFLQMRVQGLETDPGALAAIQAGAIEAAARSQRVSESAGGAVAVLPLFGLIMPRASMLNNVSSPSGTSVEAFTQAFRQAMNDPGVKAIVIDIDSPGGSVAGVPELAAEILEARKTGGKKIVAVSDTLMASAAYYIGASAHEILVSPSSMTGSIGVYTVHEDISKMLEMEGISTTLISYGENKVQGNSLGPLDDDARAEIQARVDATGAAFDKHVAAARRVKIADVPTKFGAGKVFNAQKAVSSGMADRIGTLDGVLGEFGVSRTPASGSRMVSAVIEEHAEEDADDINAVTDTAALVAKQRAHLERELILADL